MNWVPGKGWVGYDATRPVRTTEHHVRVAVGRDYSDAAAMAVASGVARAAYPAHYARYGT